MKDKLKSILSSSSGSYSSNRTITITMLLYFLFIMTYSIIWSIEIKTLELVLEYSFYIYVSSLSLKSVEKITTIIKTKDNKSDENY